MAQASQWATWWSSRKTVFSGTSAVAAPRTTAPGYSVRISSAGVNASASTFNLNSGLAASTYNLTDVASQPGFNELKAAVVYSVYLPSAEYPAGLADQTCGTFSNALFNNSNNSFYNSVISIETVAGVKRLKIDYQPGTGFANASYLPGAYTDWTDRWITVAGCQSNTTASFAGWTGTGGVGTSLYARLRVFDSATGTDLMAKTAAGLFPDFNIFTTWNPAIATLPTVIPNRSPSSGVGFEANNFAATGRSFVISNNWVSLGQTFDPVNTANLTWLTAAPTKTIDGADAWLNAQSTQVVLNPVGYPTAYYGLQSGQDRYSNPDNLGIKFLFSTTGTNWDNAYSTTRIIRNN